MEINLENESSYYSVIPYEILVDNDLSARARLFYGTISSLCKLEGFCIATNGQLSALIGASESTVVRCLSDLANKKYITVEIDQMAGNERKIFITNKATNENQD